MFLSQSLTSAMAVLPRRKDATKMDFLMLVFKSRKEKRKSVQKKSSRSINVKTNFFLAILIRSKNTERKKTNSGDGGGGGVDGWDGEFQFKF